MVLTTCAPHGSVSLNARIALWVVSRTGGRAFGTITERSKYVAAFSGWPARSVSAQAVITASVLADALCRPAGNLSFGVVLDPPAGAGCATVRGCDCVASPAEEPPPQAA